MTTPWAARPAPRRPIFLGLVVPILYLLALTAAAMLASARADAGVGGPSDATARAHRSHVRPATAAKPHGYRPRRRLRASLPHPPRPTEAAAAAPVVSAVSRSEGGRDPVSVGSAPMLVLRVAAVTTPETMQAAINRCIGPVAIDWSSDPSVWGLHPTEIAEHDYCGGSRFTSLTAGSEVQVIGGGLSGRYVVDGLRRYVPADASASELDGLGDIALQTCVRDGMILVGLDRIS